MSIDRKRNPASPAPIVRQLGEAQVDYSYNEWRQAQMRELEQNYAEMHEPRRQMTAGSAAGGYRHVA